MNKPLRLLIMLFVTVILGICALPILFFANMIINREFPVQYIIPKDYIGWVWVNYEIPNAPTIPKKDGYMVIHVNKNGVVNTDSNYPHGWRWGDKPDKFFRYDSNGLLTSISTSLYIYGFTLQDTRKQYRFFVGTTDQSKEYAWIHQQPGDIHHWVESRKQ